MKGDPGSDPMAALTAAWPQQRDKRREPNDQTKQTGKPRRGGTSESHTNGKGAAPFDQSLLSGVIWIERDIPEPDFMLGELLSTSSRIQFTGPTGLGKTNFMVALAMAVADGANFLHWRGTGKPRRVLYIDGEMSRRLAKKRLVDATRRHGHMPEKFFYLNREDFPDMPPLDTESGQKYINSVIEALGGVDIVIFDNIQALTIGELREPESWRRVLPWVRSLTMRLIGKIWIHHTGHNEDHGYGDKTREWQLDTTMLMERVEQPETDIAFSVKFDKARERTPDNRGDFEPAVITLTNDEWTSERGDCARPKRAAKDRALELLGEAISHEGFIPPACAHIPYNTPCVTEDIWRRYCKAGCISDSSAPEAVRKAFSRAAKKLVGTTVGKWTDLVWVIRP